MPTSFATLKDEAAKLRHLIEVLDKLDAAPSREALIAEIMREAAERGERWRRDPGSSPGLAKTSDKKEEQTMRTIVQDELGWMPQFAA